MEDDRSSGYDTERIDIVNTPRIATGCIGGDMESMGDRLRQARKNAGYSSAQAAADAFGWHAGAYRHHENGTREFDIETAKRYGKAFKINPGWLLALDKIKVPVTESDGDSAMVEVVGRVKAGAWQEVPTGPYERSRLVEAGPPAIPGAKRFALDVEGLSMDLVFPEGTTIECYWIKFESRRILVPQDGDLVIAERTNGDLVETTCKRLVIRPDGVHELHAESSRPEFAEPMIIGQPDDDYYADAGVRIIGLVDRAIQRHLHRRGLKA